MATDDKTRIVSASEGVGPGTQLNGIFEIDEHIAFGGMGEVYRGHNIQTDDPVAIKIVLPEFARDKTMLALFRKEASILSHLANDAIVRYYVFTIDPAIGRPYLAMEYVDGVSLADLITRGPMPAGTVRRLIARIASGLSAAHAAGVIHRDLSPDNVILPGGNVDKAKIIDFGIAKSNTGGGTLLGGKFAGKYNFVSPEQLGDFGGEISARSDIYSLGLVMAAALRGEAIDMGGSQVDVIEKRRRGPDVSNLDPTLLPILEAMLQPDPDNRPPTMEAVVQWLSATGEAPRYPTEPEMLPDDPAWQDLPVPGEKSYAPRPTTPPLSGARSPSLPPAATLGASMPPRSVPPAGSVPPYRPGSAPLGRSSPPPASVPPAGSIPPRSESPFGAHQPSAPVPNWASPTPAPARPRSRAPLFAASAVVLLAAVAGGAYFSGLLSAPPTAVSTPPAGPVLSKTEPAAPAPAETPQPEVAAAPTPPAEPAAPATPAPALPAETAAVPTPEKIEPEVWARSYDGGSCFFAAASNGDDGVSIEGFATSARPLEAMAAKFQAETQVAPDLGVQVIEPKQCAVADFLRALSNSPAPAPVLTLSSGTVKSGQALRGTLDKLAGKTDILLIDNAGVVYSLADHLKQSDDKASFNIRLRGLSAESAVPQMIVALNSPTGLETAKVDQPVLAETLFPRILDEINDKKVPASATAGYFKLGG